MSQSVESSLEGKTNTTISTSSQSIKRTLLKHLTLSLTQTFSMVKEPALRKVRYL